MAPLKQKETVILFNAFLLEATPLPATTTITGIVLKSLKRELYNGMHLPLQQSTLSGKFLHSSAAQAHSYAPRLSKGQSSS